MATSHHSHRRSRARRTARLGIAGGLTGIAGVAVVAALIGVVRPHGHRDEPAPRAVDHVRRPSPRPGAHRSPLALSTPDGFGYAVAAVKAGTADHPLAGPRTPPTTGTTLAYIEARNRAPPVGPYADRPLVRTGAALVRRRRPPWLAAVRHTAPVSG